MSFPQSIVAEMLSRYGKQLSERQMSKLMWKVSSDNPLWLSVACEEIRRLDESSQIDDKIAELPEGLLRYRNGLWASSLLSPMSVPVEVTLCGW